MATMTATGSAARPGVSSRPASQGSAAANALLGERPVVLARLGDDRAVDAIGAAEVAQRFGRPGLVARAGGLPTGQRRIAAATEML